MHRFAQTRVDVAAFGRTLQDSPRASIAHCMPSLRAASSEGVFSRRKRVPAGSSEAMRTYAALASVHSSFFIGK